MNDVLLRPARPDESQALTSLMRRSKAHWGYPQAFLDRVRDQLTITPAAIRDERVMVAERAGAAIGFYQLTGRPPCAHLEDLFLAPEVIGTGLGRLLWEHALASAAEAGCQELTLESDPHAEPFYLRMGAQRIGAREVAPGRVLPVMRMVLDDDAQVSQRTS
ncbi:GNAT family N-acetyltransferase [Streptomyces sp. NPDC052396]|uniref:GNAT family N-acetyltransferase n=1 Tax=Streptomyces sp. NPDC052396 TaxID=3365689 RepID=UPI0037D479F4